MNKEDDIRDQQDFTPFIHRRYLRETWVGGAILIVLGVLFLLQNFFDFDVIGKLWPVLLIVAGAAVVMGRGKKSAR